MLLKLMLICISYVTMLLRYAFVNNDYTNIYAAQILNFLHYLPKPLYSIAGYSLL